MASCPDCGNELHWQTIIDFRLKPRRVLVCPLCDNYDAEAMKPKGEPECSCNSAFRVAVMK